MERISDKIAALPQHGSYFSLEFFPPKTQQGFANLHARLSRMSHSLRPLFVNVTWGAGGSTSEKSLALVELTQRQLGLTTCLHLTCTNMSRRLIDETLEYAKTLGVRNILALRGDPPRSDEYRAENGNEDEKDDSNKDFTWAVDLVRYIRKQYGDFFCIGVAGYPEGHADQSHPEHQSVDFDLPYLVEKVQAGADFIMTQLFYDVEAFDKYEDLLRRHESSAFRTIPIIPGLMPVQSYQILKRTTKLSHAKCPQPILSRFEAVKGDDEAVKRVGVDVISEMVQHIKSRRQSRPRGFHFYTLNLEKSVAQILERCELIAPPTPPMVTIDESAVDDDEGDGYLLVNSSKTQGRSRRVSQEANNRVIRDRSRAMSSSSALFEASEDEVSGPPDSKQPSRLTVLAISEGEGSLGREATWDDFPNGRWGDARSPAYGEIDGYGVSLHVSIPAALGLWGRPSSTGDLTAIFERYVLGEIDAVPWSEEALNEETNTIRDELVTLIRKGWWTVASQPAVNCTLSTDKIFGWGPKNGFVYQKAFVEMFLPAKDWKRLQPLLDDDDQLTYFAADATGAYAASDEDSVNPVTWGAFRGKEIVTPTIIEGMSFKAWAEEAFGIWKEWGVVYKPSSESHKLLRSTREDVWLVNVIHHAYVEPQALWEFLAKA
ncbi:hypothetical protein ANO11243_019350 [Dothideomycetidae sp. 11243]|nr:hypothetical protein ANO11243_019350 [fungal sp. No.11243]